MISLRCLSLVSGVSDFTTHHYLQRFNLFNLIAASWSNARIPGVLQRFAIAYFFAFLLQWAFHLTPAEMDAKMRSKAPNEGMLTPAT